MIITLDTNCRIRNNEESKSQLSLRGIVRAWCRVQAPCTPASACSRLLLPTRQLLLTVRLPAARPSAPVNRRDGAVQRGAKRSRQEGCGKGGVSARRHTVSFLAVANTRACTRARMVTYVRTHPNA